MNNMQDFFKFDYAKFAQDVAENMKTMSAMPEVKFNKNGYEIRTQLLDIAKDVVQFEYKTKIGQMEFSAQHDDKRGQVVHSVTMPEVPGVDKVLEAAEKFNAFINGNGKAK
jgi:hypothetical protein